MRKTIQVAHVQSMLNDMLKQDISRSAKASICCVLEEILMRTDNYRGFKWNMSTEEAKAIQPDDERYCDRTYF